MYWPMGLFSGFYGNELLSKPKLTIFLAKPLTKFHEPALSNTVLLPLYTHFSLELFFTILVTPNKQLLNLKLLVGFFDQALNHRQSKHFQFWLRNCFVIQLKDPYQILFPLYTESFMLCKKAAHNGLSLEVYTPFDSQLKT